MDIKTIKEKILNGEFTDEDLRRLLLEGSPKPSSKSGEEGFLKTVLKGFYDGYTAPHMLRVSLEALLLLTIIIGIVILAYASRLDMTITAVLFAFIIGFLFGKIK